MTPGSGLIDLDSIEKIDHSLRIQCDCLRQARLDDDWIRVARIRDNMDALLDARWDKMSK